MRVIDIAKDGSAHVTQPHESLLAISGEWENVGAFALSAMLYADGQAFGVDSSTSTRLSARESSANDSDLTLHGRPETLFQIVVPAAETITSKLSSVRAKNRSLT